MARSRFKRHIQEQSIKSMLLAIAGMIVVIILLFSFGPDLLVNFSLLVKKSSTNDIQKENLTYISPPVINPMPDATKSATINVNGYAGDKQTITLYVNGKVADKTEVNKNKQFSFSDITLEKGSNEIKAKATTDNNKESDYSSILTITYIDQPPKLDINNPQDGQKISKDSRSQTIRGKTDTNVHVTVNGFWAITDDEGNFSYKMSLNDGDNSLTFVATDVAGNETSKTITVKVE